MAGRSRPARRRRGGDRLIEGTAQRRLLGAAGITVATWFAGWDLYLWVDKFLTNPYGTDTRSFYVAAQIGLQHGWWRIYDDHLQRLDALALDPLHRQLPALPLFGGSPPPVAWLFAPLTTLPYPAAYLLMGAVNFGFVAGAWWLLAPGGRLQRAALGVAGLAMFPVAHGLQVGNVAVAVAGSIGISWALIDRDRPWLGGLFLIPLVLDPNMALLVPIAYLLIGRWRPVLVLVLGGGLLAGLSVMSLGSHGFSEYMDMLRFQSTIEFNRHMTLLGVWNSPVTVALQAALALLALAVAFRSRRLDVAFVAAAAGSLLATPYMHLHHLTLALVAGWVFLRTEAPALEKSWLVVLAIGAELVWVVGPVPMLIGLAGWLLILGRLRPALRPVAPPAPA